MASKVIGQRDKLRLNRFFFKHFTMYAHKTTVISRKGLNALNPNLIDVNMLLQDAGEK